MYTVVVNDWGETTYVPTALGNVLLVVVLARTVGRGRCIARMQRNKTAAAPLLPTVTGKWLTVS